MGNLRWRNWGMIEQVNNCFIVMSIEQHSESLAWGEVTGGLKTKTAPLPILQEP